MEVCPRLSPIILPGKHTRWKKPLVAASSVLAFWALAVLLIVVPGANWAFTLSVAARGQSAVPAVGGLAIGYLRMTGVVAAGVGALVSRTPSAMTALSVTGGLYLIWHGAATFVHASARGATSTDSSTGWVTLAKGIGVSGLNPKGLLIFIAMLPQFTNPEWDWPVTGQLAVLGLVFTVSCVIFYLGLGLAAGTVLQLRPAVSLAVTRFSGAAMTMIGTLLIVERLRG